MKSLRQIVLILGFVYLLYLTKSAFGINISQKYSAWGVFKRPIQSLLN